MFHPFLHQNLHRLPHSSTKMALDVAELHLPPPTPLSPSPQSTASTTDSALSWASFSTLHESLPESPRIYDFSQINAATNNFLNKQYSAASSTPSWRCTLHGKDVLIFQRKFQRQIELQDLKHRFHKISRSHHMSIIKLLGASFSGEYLYLVYDFVNGASLADCLRNSRSPNFTVLSTWISRMQVATDLAHGLDYIHNKSGLNMSLTHNHIKSSSIVVTEPSFNARICHFGAAQLCNEDDWNNIEGEKPSDSRMKAELKDKRLQKLKSGKLQIKGARGYMAPEYKSTGVATPMTDVYAFGVVILELLSGEEPLKFEFDKIEGNFVRVSLIESAMAVIEGDDDEESRSRAGKISSAFGVEGRLRRWVDHRLNDSFPVHVAEKVARLAIQCVHVDPCKRPNMARVASKISKLYLESRIWSDSVAIPANVSVSLLAPR